ncbi:hypothetical protein ACLKA6_014043 [Drosophila palustris]
MHRKKQPLTVVSASEKPQHDIDKHCQKLVLDAKDDIISVSNLTLPQEPHSKNILILKGKNAVGLYCWSLWRCRGSACRSSVRHS